jgi:hypothetical protein
VADLTLTYSDLLDAIRERRFPSSSPAAQWLAAAYADVWNAHNWTFKEVSRAAFYTTADGTSTGAASPTPLMPAAFGRARALYDDQGCALVELDQGEFERRYTPYLTPSVVTGRPEAFMVVNRQITLAPTPDSKYAFTLSYRRRLATRTAGGAVQAGFFQNNTDLPLWDDHHYLLVLRAKLIGLRDRSDPTASDLQGEYGQLLEAMREDYTVATARRQLPAWR